jgi:hypothetical protein
MHLHMLLCASYYVYKYQYWVARAQTLNSLG